MCLVLEVLFKSGQWARPRADFNDDSPYERKNVQHGERLALSCYERSQYHPEQPCQMHHQEGSRGCFMELVFHFSLFSDWHADYQTNRDSIGMPFKGRISPVFRR
jgi:hypothetical protein